MRSITHRATDGFGSQLYAAFSCMLWSRVSNGTVAYYAPRDSSERRFGAYQHELCWGCGRVYDAVHAGWPRATDVPQTPRLTAMRECYHQVLRSCTATPHRCARALVSLASRWRRAVVALPEYSSTSPVEIAVHVREGDRNPNSLDRLIERVRARLKQTAPMHELDAQMLTGSSGSGLDFGALHRWLTGSGTAGPTQRTHLFTEHAGEGGALRRQIDGRRVVVHAGGDAMRAWMQMVRSRALVADASSLSATASLLSDGLVVHRFPRLGPATHWDFGVAWFHCPLLNGTWWWSAASAARQQPPPLSSTRVRSCTGGASACRATIGTQPPAASRSKVDDPWLVRFLAALLQMMPATASAPQY